MSEQTNHLEQVKLDAERITRKRIKDAEEEKAFQESQVGEHLTLDDERPVFVAADEPVKAKAVKTTKG